MRIVKNCNKTTTRNNNNMSSPQKTNDARARELGSTNASSTNRNSTNGETIDPANPPAPVAQIRGDENRVGPGPLMALPSAAAAVPSVGQAAAYPAVVAGGSVGASDGSVLPDHHVSACPLLFPGLSLPVNQTLTSPSLHPSLMGQLQAASQQQGNNLLAGLAQVPPSLYLSQLQSLLHQQAALSQNSSQQPSLPVSTNQAVAGMQPSAVELGLISQLVQAQGQANLIAMLSSQEQTQAIADNTASGLLPQALPFNHPLHANLAAALQTLQASAASAAPASLPAGSGTAPQVSQALQAAVQAPVASANVASSTDGLSSGNESANTNQARVYYKPKFEPATHKEKRWVLRINELLHFKHRCGHCRVPHGFDENPNLAWWVMNIRAQHRKFIEGEKSWLTQERVDLLNDIGFEWSPSKKDSKKKGKKKSEKK